MKITQGKLKQLIKEELEAFSVEEAYQPAEQPMVHAEFREDPGLAERIMEKLTKSDKERKKKLEKELDTIQHK